MYDALTPDRTGRVVFVVVVIVLIKSCVSPKGGDDVVTVTIRMTVSWNLITGSGTCVDSYDRKLIPWTSRFLTGSIWVIVSSVVYGWTLGSYPSTQGNEVVTSVSHRMDHMDKSRFEMVSEVIVDVRFGSFFGVCVDYDKCRFL